MKFSDLEYTRPNLEKFSEQAKQIFGNIAAAETFEEQWQHIMEFSAKRTEVVSMITLCEIRYSVNTEDPFYSSENSWLDENAPRLQEINNAFYAALLGSKFRRELESKSGKQFFELMRLEQKVFSPEIMDDLAEENKLITQYSKLRGSALIQFHGKEYTLTGVEQFFEDPDRATRKEANEAYWGYFQAHEAEFDAIYDRLVHLRDKMAKKLGYKDFVQMGYDRMTRVGYGPEDVARFREGVKKYFVPVAAEIFQEQAKRIGVDKLNYYDIAYAFKSGNPKPAGDEAWMKTQAMKMYDEMSPDTSELFRKMAEGGYLDLSQKKGKEPGGYCTFIENVRMPFIFSNFNGTKGDVDVLTHEFGHSFQAYSSRDLPLIELGWPTSEGAEVHSMGMEYIAYPWMPDFFGEDAIKYHYEHQTGTLKFIPYGCLVDEFQHYVYENPEASPAERKAEWRKLEKTYNPWLDFSENPFLETGSKWQRQGHIYEVPFYYIDYCLAQIVAQQIFLRDQKDHKALWQDYKTICSVGGKYSFLEMLNIGHFKNPFSEQAVAEILAGIKTDYESIDKSKLS